MSLQSCPTLCDPIHGSPPGFPSLGFSRQEHWSGLPFPSPMHESEVAQSCLTLSDPMDCSLPDSSVRGIFQARVPSRVPLPSLRSVYLESEKVKVKSLSHVWLFSTPWSVAYQAPLSMGFSRQDYWSGLPLPFLNVWVTVLQKSIICFLCLWVCFCFVNKFICINFF